jgi:hypothetical protein
MKHEAANSRQEEVIPHLLTVLLLVFTPAGATGAMAQQFNSR